MGFGLSEDGKASISAATCGNSAKIKAQDRACWRSRHTLRRVADGRDSEIRAVRRRRVLVTNGILTHKGENQWLRD